MGKIMYQNPGSNEAQSPLIAGLSEGLSKISEILNMEVGTFEKLQLTAVPISSEDKNRIYEAPEGNKLWLNSPDIVVYKNDSQIERSTANFTIDYIGGSITFSKALSDSDKITVTGSYIKANSLKINEIATLLNAVQQSAGRYKGSYDNLSELQSEHPTGEKGDFALIVSPDFAIYAWNVNSAGWENTQSIEDLSNYYTKNETNNLLNNKEPKISARGTSTTDDDYYYGGRKTWQSVQEKVRETPLVGLSKSDTSEITSADNVLSALGKLQAQVGQYKDKHYIEGSGAPTTDTVGKIGQRYVNSSNGDSYICIGIQDGQYIWTKQMLASVYDTDGSGVVDDSEKLGGQLPEYYATAEAVAAAQAKADAAMPKSGGAFTGDVYAVNTNRATDCLRNTIVVDKSWNVQSTNRFIYERK